LKLEDFPLPFYTPCAEAEGKHHSSEMKEQNPSPIPCSEFTKILLNEDVKIEESPQYFVNESQPARISPKTKPIEKTKRSTRNSSRLTRERQERQEQEGENKEGENREGDDNEIGNIFFGRSNQKTNEFLLEGEPSREQQNWTNFLQLGKPENLPF
jgi:hypothetical protein